MTKNETRTPEQIEREDYPASTPPTHDHGKIGWAIVYYSECGVVAGNVTQATVCGANLLAVRDKNDAILTWLAPKEIRQIKPCTEAEATAKNEQIVESNKALDAILKNGALRQAFNEYREQDKP